MRTYTHGVIGYLLYAKRLTARTTARHHWRHPARCVLSPGLCGALLENVTQSAMVAALHTLLHHSTLHTVTVSMHSFVIVGPFLALSAVLYRPALPFFVGMLAHGIVDFLTHQQWAYNHFFPIPLAPIRG